MDHDLCSIRSYLHSIGSYLDSIRSYLDFIGSYLRFIGWCLDFIRRGTPHDGLYREAPPERVTFFGTSGHERVGISLGEVHKMVGKSVIWSVKGPKRANR